MKHTNDPKGYTKILETVLKSVFPSLCDETVPIKMKKILIAAIITDAFYSGKVEGIKEMGESL